MDRQNGRPAGGTGARRPVRDQQSVKSQPVGYSGAQPAAGQQTGGRQQPYYPQQTGGQQPYAPRQTGDRQPYAPQQTGGQYCPPQQTGPQQPYAPQQTGDQQSPQDRSVHSGLTELGYPSAGVHPQGSASSPVRAPVQDLPAPDPLEQLDEEDPFDGVGEDPALAMQRSKKLYTRADPFWEKPGQDGAVSADTGEMKPVPPEDITAEPARPKLSRRGIILLSAAGGIALLALILFGFVFRVRTIEVVGNSRVDTAVVQALSGITLGDSTLTIDAEKAASGINANRYLVYKNIEVRQPATVVITVTERRPVAMMNYCGINYTIDVSGMVLEESSDINETDGLVLVVGIELAGQSGCVVGRAINTLDPDQKVALRSLLTEIYVQSAENEITRITISDLDNIILETADGFSVHLGNSDSPYAKLKALLTVQQYLIGQGYTGGTIDVSTPESPTFIPEST